MAAAGLALLSSAGSGGLRQRARGLIQEQGWTASPGRAPGHAVPRIPLAHPRALRGLPLRGQ